MDKLIQTGFALASGFYKEHPTSIITPTLSMHDEEGSLMEVITVEDVTQAGKVARELLARNVCETVIFMSEGFELDSETRKRTGRDMLVIGKFDKGDKYVGNVAIINDKKTGDFDIVEEEGEVGGRLIDGFLDDNGEKTRNLMKKIE